MNKGMTAKGAAMQDRIVTETALLMREKGAAETTLNDVREATSTSKSQLFHYFPEGRTDLLVAVARHEAEQVLQAQQPHLGDLSTWESWQRWAEAVIAHYTELGQRCPLGNLTSELGKSSPEARAVVTELYAEWEAHLARGAEALLGDPVKAAEQARVLLAAIQGGVLLLQVTGRTDYLKAAVAAGVEALRPPTR